MRTRSKILLAALTSALLLAALVSSASANRLAVNETRYRIIFSPLSIVPSFGSPLRCPVTLEGSFHSRTITKTAGFLMGYVNRAVFGTCESGIFSFNTETLPWHMQYASFTGTLPNISSITENLIGLSYEVQGEVFGLRVRCRYTSASQAGINNRESRGVITSQRPGEESTNSETGGCPSLRWSGTGAVNTAGGAPVTITLV